MLPVLVNERDNCDLDLPIEDSQKDRAFAFLLSFIFTDSHARPEYTNQNDCVVLTRIRPGISLLISVNLSCWRIKFFYTDLKSSLWLINENGVVSLLLFFLSVALDENEVYMESI